MTRQEKFDVTVAAFEAFLKKENAHTFYFKEWKKQKKYHDAGNDFHIWRVWAKVIHPESWISGAFVWRDTEKGYNYCRTINAAWIIWYSKKLNN